LIKARPIHEETNPSSTQRKCYIRTKTARVQFQKEILVVYLEGLEAKTN
jgi:hypothetical protein